MRGGGEGWAAMKLTRQKHAKKNMGFYRHNFHFREPFQVLLDGTFCQAALRNKIQIREQLPGYLGGSTQLCTTRYDSGRGWGAPGSPGAQARGGGNGDRAGWGGGRQCACAREPRAPLRPPRRWGVATRLGGP